MWRTLRIVLVSVWLSVCPQFAEPSAAQTKSFSAQGPTQATQLSNDQLLGAVKVTFDRQPTSMSFDLPWHYCAVTENGIKVAHFAAETYDPRNWDGQGADASFEAGMDEEARFARVWIEHQSPARIVVRARYALTNSKLQIAHDDLQTDSPYNDGKGDWGEERFTIYPDGVYVRHMTIHSGLAAKSQPFGFYREPPNVVHEFMESVVIGPKGHVPTDDIETSPTLTLIKMFGSQPGKVFPQGESHSVRYRMPSGPPTDFGNFRDANIMLLHTKSRFQPFTVGLPYGVSVSPYGWEENRDFPFATWTGYREPSVGYVSAIGHMVNWWHFRRTESTIEQVYLHGLVGDEDRKKTLMPIAWSWITPPELQMPNDRLSPNGSAGKYNTFTYDQSQRAYIVPRLDRGPTEIRFVLDAIYDDQHLAGTMWLARPAFVIPKWNDDGAVEVFVDGKKLQHPADFRFGLEGTGQEQSLIVWIDRLIDLNSVEEHSAEFLIRSADK